jgi:phosphotransferase system enzyme I (PtsI)
MYFMYIKEKYDFRKSYIDPMEKFYKGIPVSGRIAIGIAIVLQRFNLFIPKYNIKRNGDSIEKELKKLETALSDTKRQFQSLRNDLKEDFGAFETGYIDAAILMLEDPLLRDRVITKLNKTYLNIEWIFNDVIDELADQLTQSGDYYFRERAPDVLSIGQKVLTNLLGNEDEITPLLQKDSIIIAHTLSPPELIHYYKMHAKALVTEIGGKTSHVSIIARDLEIPAVVGVPDITKIVQTGDQVIVDGTVGNVIHHPENDTITLYRYKKKESEKYENQLKKIDKKSCRLKEGVEVLLLANLDVEEELALIEHGHSQGVGLFRTEYIFLNRKKAPSEDEQFTIYKRIIEALVPFEVTIRIIDIGGDKKPPYMRYIEEKNPFLGWRGIRFALSNKMLLKQQLRAILRASHYGNARVMFPMVNDIDEILEIKAILEECKGELTEEKNDFDQDISMGIMVETPSSIILLDRISEYVDFVSVGTNDLIQYTLAIDRGNGKVAANFDPSHPSMLRLLKQIVDIASEKKMEVSICGEMAGEPLYTLLLIGLGYRKLSMSPTRIPLVKSVLINSSLSESQDITKRALELVSKKDVTRYIREQMISRFKILEDYFRQNV